MRAVPSLLCIPTGQPSKDIPLWVNTLFGRFRPGAVVAPHVRVRLEARRPHLQPQLQGDMSGAGCRQRCWLIAFAGMMPGSSASPLAGRGVRRIRFRGSSWLRVGPTSCSNHPSWRRPPVQW